MGQKFLPIPILIPTVLFIVLSLGCESSSSKRSLTEKSDFRSLGFKKCIVATIKDAQCGTISVLENRGVSEKNRKIDLKVIVLPAISLPKEADPIFFLAGGPGQAATELSRTLFGPLKNLRQKRDIVLIDQRGTGASASLKCEDSMFSQKSFVSEKNSEKNDDVEKQVKQAKACLKTYKGDLGQYLTPMFADDLNEVREKLGYETINLIGFSYGTRAALTYLRQYESTVRSVIIDGVAPHQMLVPVDALKSNHDVWRKLLDDCEKDTLCHRQFPNFKEESLELFRRLEEKAVSLDVADPLTAKISRETIKAADIKVVIAGTLYQPLMQSLVPLAIHEALAGDFRTFIGMMGLTGSMGESISLGLYFSVMCNEDISRLSKAKVQELLKKNKAAMSIDSLKMLDQVCDFWPKGRLPKDYFDAVKSSKPVLIMSGGLDPVTPPKWGNLVAETLENSTHLVVEKSGHGVWSFPCVNNIIRQFVKTPMAKDIDMKCTENSFRPGFMLNKNATSPQKKSPKAAPQSLKE